MLRVRLIQSAGGLKRKSLRLPREEIPPQDTLPQISDMPAPRIARASYQKMVHVPYKHHAGESLLPPAPPPRSSHLLLCPRKLTALAGGRSQRQIRLWKERGAGGLLAGPWGRQEPLHPRPQIRPAPPPTTLLTGFHKGSLLVGMYPDSTIDAPWGLPLPGP